MDRRPAQSVRQRPEGPAAAHRLGILELLQSDSGPADWKPENKAFSCTYAKDCTHVKSVFKLATTSKEKTALTSMLGTCTS
ncbi:hypothetical protein ACFU99_15475 [Streptomyces sp. NPDC057654]|uniref:hypothetical protein n=1 Tax=Streptomyces sp. NPDC057654 TaxID=3346196 RepID=UPI00369ECB8D